jgi:hypothetical protein
MREVHAVGLNVAGHYRRAALRACDVCDAGEGVGTCFAKQRVVALAVTTEKTMRVSRAGAVGELMKTCRAEWRRGEVDGFRS